MSQVSLSPEVKAAVDLIKQAGGTVLFPRRHVEVWGQSFSTIKLITQDPRCEVSYQTLVQRLSKGINPDEAVKKSPPTRICKSLVCWGQNFASIKDLALDSRCKVGYSVLLKKLNKGVIPEEAVKDQRVRKPITTIEQAIVGE
ncbi:MAG: hypothetical protein WC315_03750 [Candidatus Omnitrophota bacterium]|jgi:hypothetical protein